MQTMSSTNIEFENLFNKSQQTEHILVTRLSSDHLTKSDHFDIQPFLLERSSSFKDVLGSPTDDHTPSRSPSKSPGKQIIRKVIKKESIPRKSASTRTGQTKMSQARRAGENSKSWRWNMTYRLASKQPRNQIISQEEKTVKAQAPVMSQIEEAPTLLISGSATQIQPVSADKNICCLNKVSGSDTFKISGINVFIEDDEDVFSFPSNTKTAKFVV